MNYSISGDNYPVLKLELESGDEIITQAGGMSWMTPNISMDTSAGGLKKALGRLFSNESMFRNKYTANGSAELDITSSFPGHIVPVEISAGKGVILQKSSFLASFGNIDTSVYLQKKLGKGLFGGEGFIMEKAEGDGVLFLEVDGSAVSKTLADGETLVVSTGHVVMMESSCTMDIQSVKGVKNVLFGGEGMFNTVVKGPGKVVLQTMPISKLAKQLVPYLPQPASNTTVVSGS